MPSVTRGRNIETEITYGESLRLRFRDDGKGMTQASLNAADVRALGLAWNPRASHADRSGIGGLE